MSKIKESKDTNAEQQKCRKKKKGRKFKCRKHKYRNVQTTGKQKSIEILYQ